MINTQRCSTWWISRETQIKTTVRQHPTHRMTVIKKTRNSKNCGEGGGKGTLVHCWWECKLVQPLQRTERIFLKNLKIKLSYGPAIPLLNIYLKEMKTRKDMHSHVNCSIIYNSQGMEASWVSTDGWKKKTDGSMCSREYYSAMKKNTILSFDSIRRDFEAIMLSEISQRKTNTVWSHMWNPKKRNQNKNKCRPWKWTFVTCFLIRKN